MNVCCALLWPDLPEEVAAQAQRAVGFIFSGFHGLGFRVLGFKI